MTDRLQALLTSLECLGPDDQKDLIINEVIETGGVYCAPRPVDTDNWSSHLCEMRLHGISASGATEEETIRNWKKAAQQVAFPVESDGFITVHPPIAPLAARPDRQTASG
ncbi:hypothetical protein [Pseudooceanicola sp. MF1-13]|uniref:hypothetical protein n=1 Tax=Pseudooceanicola sp. MF1-13 TaxID=3379095 RepID=UPI0038920F51